MGASWQTYFAGSDYQADGKRAYSSYFELSAPFRLASCDWDARFGQVPWKSGMYDVNGFSVTNLSLRATKAIKISPTFELPLFPSPGGQSSFLRTKVQTFLVLSNLFMEISLTSTHQSH